jgi:hypothetical protein
MATVKMSQTDRQLVVLMPREYHYSLNLLFVIPQVGLFSGFFWFFFFQNIPPIQNLLLLLNGSIVAVF